MPLSISTEPSAVTHLTAVAADSSDVTVTWTPGTGTHQDPFKLKYHGTHQATDWSSVISSADSEKTVTGLFPGDTYTFEVKAVSGTEISGEKTTTAVMCKLHQCLYITATSSLPGDYNQMLGHSTKICC